MLFAAALDHLDDLTLDVDVHPSTKAEWHGTRTGLGDELP